MRSYLACVLALAAAYYTYGKYLEKNFGVDKRETPATRINDGVDYVGMNWFKGLLIQFLNIAGLGPVTGAIAGAMWGTASFLWITLGCIFLGAAHDYYTGMISMRHNGQNMPELIGEYLGDRVKSFAKYVLIVLLIVVGVAFVTGPAEILASFTGVGTKYWLCAIALYYIVATLLPINKIIGRIYPIFGASLIVMMFALIVSLFWNGYSIPEIALANYHPKKLPIFPFMFVVISCGAISGFHSTQSVLIARCLKNEHDGRKSFMAAMYMEGFVALTWAAITLAFFGGVEGLAASGGGMVAISKVATGLLGKYGAPLTAFGIVALPITTGDTAFRSARITIADVFKFDQKSMKSRLMVAIPLFAVAGFLSQLGFSTLWRYVASTNQILATIGLWTCTMYMVKNRKNWWVTGVPAAFMTAIMTIYLLVAPEGVAMKNYSAAYVAGTVSGLMTMVYFYTRNLKEKSEAFA